MQAPRRTCARFKSCGETAASKQAITIELAQPDLDSAAEAGNQIGTSVGHLRTNVVVEKSALMSSGKFGFVSPK
jgi:hypothetical protein